MELAIKVYLVFQQPQFLKVGLADVGLELELGNAFTEVDQSI